MRFRRRRSTAALPRRQRHPMDQHGRLLRAEQRTQHQQRQNDDLNQHCDQESAAAKSARVASLLVLLFQQTADEMISGLHLRTSARARRCRDLLEVGALLSSGPGSFVFPAFRLIAEPFLGRLRSLWQIDTGRAGAVPGLLVYRHGMAGIGDPDTGRSHSALPQRLSGSIWRHSPPTYSHGVA